jgi:hypothetical protein
VDFTTVRFGNRNPQMQVQSVDDDGRLRTHSVEAPHLEQSVTTVDFPTGDESALDTDHVERALSTNNDRWLTTLAASLGDDRRYAIVVQQAEQIMNAHAAGDAPSWVSCPDDEKLQAVLAKHFDCAEGEPTNVITNAGRDAHHEQMLKSSGQPAGFQFGALSPSSATPAAGDTTLAEEITTEAGTLKRKSMAFAHTGGTNTSTLTETWTANASDSLPVTVRLWANFNKATSGGTMGEEDKLSAASTLTVSGDSLTVTFTLTAG